MLVWGEKQLIIKGVEMKGIIAVLCAVVACAGFNVIFDLKVRGNDVVQSLTVLSFFGFIPSFIWHTVRWYTNASDPSGLPVSFLPSANLFWFLVLLGLCIFVANLCVTIGYNTSLSALTIMMLLLLVPVIAVFIRAIIVGGAPTLEQMAGYGFCAIGVWLVTRSSVS
jgi:drug/metabolite transporter (DMT)-like permease